MGKMPHETSDRIGKCVEKRHEGYKKASKQHHAVCCSVCERQILSIHLSCLVHFPFISIFPASRSIAVTSRPTLTFLIRPLRELPLTALEVLTKVLRISWASHLYLPEQPTTRKTSATRTQIQPTCNQHHHNLCTTHKQSPIPIQQKCTPPTIPLRSSRRPHSTSATTWASLSPPGPSSCSSCSVAASQSAVATPCSASTTSRRTRPSGRSGGPSRMRTCGRYGRGIGMR